jgi:hypothetical protein
MEDLSECEGGEIVGARLDGAYVTKTACHIIRLSTATVSEVMSAHTNREKTSSASSNSGRK